MFLRQSGEHLILSYLVSAKISAFRDLSVATHNALANLKRCTVGIFEHWDATAAIIQRRNPWMSTPPFQPRRSSAGALPREDPGSLNPLIQGVLINRLVAEMFLYEKALDKFATQRQEEKAEQPLLLPNDFDPSHENYYRHFVPAPFPFQFS